MTQETPPLQSAPAPSSAVMGAELGAFETFTIPMEAEDDQETTSMLAKQFVQPWYSSAYLTNWCFVLSCAYAAVGTWWWRNGIVFGALLMLSVFVCVCSIGLPVLFMRHQVYLDVIRSVTRPLFAVYYVVVHAGPVLLLLWTPGETDVPPPLVSSLVFLGTLILYRTRLMCGNLDPYVVYGAYATSHRKWSLRVMAVVYVCTMAVCEIMLYLDAARWP